MINLFAAEGRRLLSTRLWIWALVAALACGGGLVGLIGVVGPENVDPPMPGLNTADGVRNVLGLTTITVMVPAALGAVAMTAEYRHQTISLTFLFAPRRWRILAAKLAVVAGGGLVYGLTLATTAGLALYGTAALRGMSVGLEVPAILEMLLRLAVAMTTYAVLGVAVGALMRSQIAALAVVIGYLYFVETAILAIPGVGAIYPYLPGGATAAITDFGYLADAVASQTGHASGQLLPAAAGALILAAYALLAAATAVALTLRRDVT